MSQLVVEQVPVNEEDVNYLIRNLREADIEEVKASHGVHPGILLGLMRPDEATIGKADGVPVCVYGVAPKTLISNGGGTVWMMATDQLFKHKLAFLRRNRKWIKEKLKEFGTLDNHVDARNKTSISWLRWLGFNIEEAKPYGVMQLPFHRFSMGE